MADYGVAITWGDVKPGREKKALELWAEGVTMNENAVAAGRIESWDGIILEPSPAPPAGVIRLHGDQDQIEQFIRSDEFQDVIDRASLLLFNVGIRRFVKGNALAEGFARAMKLVESL
jgi:hypothetical protein